MRYYAINTDRNAIDPDRQAKGISACDLWFTHRMAFAGDFDGDKGEHASLFAKLHEGDGLFMYSTKVGYVGVGIVLKEWDRRVHEGDERLLYTKEAYEYRIDVRWIRDWRRSPRTPEDGLPKPTPYYYRKINGTEFPLAHVYASEDAPQSMDEYNQDFQEQLALSLARSDDERRRRIRAASAFPRVRMVIASVYDRNPDVVVEVLKRAKGVCEQCGKPAPFTRKSDGTPYLEVRHIEPLASGGLDTEANAQARCPNCHREAHYGE